MVYMVHQASARGPSSNFWKGMPTKQFEKAPGIRVTNIQNQTVTLKCKFLKQTNNIGAPPSLRCHRQEISAKSCTKHTWRKVCIGVFLAHLSRPLLAHSNAICLCCIHVIAGTTSLRNTSNKIAVTGIMTCCTNSDLHHRTQTSTN